MSELNNRLDFALLFLFYCFYNCFYFESTRFKEIMFSWCKWIYCIEYALKTDRNSKGCTAYRNWTVAFVVGIRPTASTAFLNSSDVCGLRWCGMFGSGYVRKSYQNAVWIKDNWNSLSTWCVRGLAGSSSVSPGVVCCSILQWSLLGVIYLSCM